MVYISLKPGMSILSYVIPVGVAIWTLDSRMRKPLSVSGVTRTWRQKTHLSFIIYSTFSYPSILPLSFPFFTPECSTRTQQNKLIHNINVSRTHHSLYLQLLQQTGHAGRGPISICHLQETAEVVVIHNYKHKNTQKNPLNFSWSYNICIYGQHIEKIQY